MVAIFGRAQGKPRQQPPVPPLLLQGCIDKANVGHKGWFGDGTIGRARAVGAQTVGFDLPFVNTVREGREPDARLCRADRLGEDGKLLAECRHCMADRCQERKRMRYPGCVIRRQ